MKKISLDDIEKRAEIVVRDCEGIIPYYESFYIHSILYSAGRCLESFERYERYKGEIENPEYLISLIQEAVGHAAALSRYFWPSPQGKQKKSNQAMLQEERGKKLCRAFGLDISSPIYNRELRNAWEHFDERLDSYLLSNDAGFFFPNCIVGSHTLTKNPVGHIFKLLDPEAECLVLMGERYLFSPIRDEVQRIFNAALEMEDNNGRL